MRTALITHKTLLIHNIALGRSIPKRKKSSYSILIINGREGHSLFTNLFVGA